jgi:hypothetical protein
MEDLTVNGKITAELKKISPFVDFNTISRIINKLTDYAEMLTEGKLAGIVNYNYSLNSSQSNMIIDLLAELQLLSRVYNIAHKGKRDLEIEYISNIFSDINNPASISSYISMRNILENRLNHQVQQYNVNMNKSNTTLSIPLNELHGHVKTYRDMSSSGVTISSKVQHGFIAASLHDAYVIIMNRNDWWDDKTYMKYFFNEEDPEKRHLSIITRDRRLTLREIEGNVKTVINYFMELYSAKIKAVQEQVAESMPSDQIIVDASRDHGSGDYGINNRFSDRILMTPFGKQYGSKIDSIIDSCFSKEEYEASGITSEDDIAGMVAELYRVYKALPGSLAMKQNRDMIMLLVQHLLNQDYGIKQFAEKYLYTDRKISFGRFFADIKNDLEEFLTKIFTDYFEEKFSPVFRIIRSLDMKQYACAFIIKRIYIKRGESLNTFGFFIIKAISKYGKIKVV